MNGLGIVNRLFGSSTPAPAAAPPQNVMEAAVATPPDTTVPPKADDRATPPPAKDTIDALTAAPVEGTKSPLDAFAGLWQNTPKAGDPPASILDFDPTQLTESVSKLNFSQAIPAELKAKALAGDQEAFNQAMDLLGRTSFQQSLQVNAQLTKKALEENAAALRTEFAKNQRSSQIATGITADNPALSHPAVQPILQLTQSQLEAKYPDATPDQIKTAALNLLSGMVKAFTPNQSQSGAQGEQSPASPNGATNWENFFRLADGQKT